MVLAALLLFPKLNRPLLDPDEGRQAEVAREMVAHGDLVLPRLRGLPYLEKPPLQYWLTGAVYRACGVYPWSARLIPAISAWLLVLVTYAWARRALGERPALLGGLALCLTPGFVLLGRIVLLDSLLALCVVTSYCTAHVALSRADLRWHWWLASASACGLGILAKGPVALVLLVPPVLAYQLLTLTAARFDWRSWGVYLVVVAAVAAPWYAAMAVQQPEYLRDFLWRNNVIRYVHAFDHAQPWWFYLPLLFAMTLPWPLLWYPLWRLLRSRDPYLSGLRTPALGFCVLIVGWGLLFFSLSSCKSPPYLAPLFSPLALLLGTCLDALLFPPAGQLDGFLTGMGQRLPQGATLLMSVLVVGGAVGTGILGWQSGKAVLLQSTVTVLAAAVWRWRTRGAASLMAWKACGALAIAFVLFVLHVLAPHFTERRTPSKAAHAALRLMGRAERPIVLYEREWQSALFYLQRESVVRLDKVSYNDLLGFVCRAPETLVFVEQGRPLEEFLTALPKHFQTAVRRPRRDGQAALVVVRQQGTVGDKEKE